jgi:GT2 family glycosyltransferase
VVPGEEAVFVMASVAAVIPTWNRRDLLAELLANLKRQTKRFDEVVVVDNGSTDDSAALAESAGARVVRLERNFGFAAAVNRGIKAATSDWIAILNNDVTLEADWLETMLAATSEDVFFATSKILSAADPRIIDGTFDEVSRGACAWRCGAGKPDSPVWRQPRTIRIAPMTAALFRRSLFGDVGGLDEQFGSYLEDADFGLRCALCGYTGRYVPTAVAYHRGSATSGRWHKDTVRLLSRNQVLLARKHLRGQPLAPILAGQLLWGLVACRHGRGLSFLRGKLQGFRTILTPLAQPERIQAVSALLEESERHIFELQRETGFDGYWRAYFWLQR